MPDFEVRPNRLFESNLTLRLVKLSVRKPFPWFPRILSRCANNIPIEELSACNNEIRQRQHCSPARVAYATLVRRSGDPADEVMRGREKVLSDCPHFRNVKFLKKYCFVVFKRLRE